MDKIQTVSNHVKAHRTEYQLAAYAIFAVGSQIAMRVALGKALEDYVVSHTHQQ